MAAKNKFLAESNKSGAGGKATKNRAPAMNGYQQGIDALLVLPNDDFHKAMTLQEAKSIARHLRLTLRQVRSGAYRVNFRDGNETTAYYTDNLEDAIHTAVEMARKRALRAEPYRART
jgi:hypothetical protein